MAYHLFRHDVRHSPLEAERKRSCPGLVFSISRLEVRILWMIGGAGVLAALAIAIPFALNAKRAHEEYERQKLMADLQAARIFLDGQSASLRVVARDWAEWDETCELVLGTLSPDEYCRRNLPSGYLKSLDLSYLICLDREGQVRLALSSGGDGGREQALSSGQVQELLRAGSCASHLRGMQACGWIRVLPDGAALFSAVPIRLPLATTAPGGVLVMGRHVHRPLLLELGQMLGRTVKVTDPGVSGVSPTSSAARAPLVWADRDLMTGVTPVRDSLGGLTALLWLTSPRTAPMPTPWQLGGVLGEQVVIVALLVLVLLRGTVTKRLAALAEDLKALRRRGAKGARVRVEGSDEIADIASHVNEVLQAEERTQKELQQSERWLRGIIEDQTELICRWLPDGTLTFVNEAYCRYFGCETEKLLGNTFLPLIPEEYRTRFEEEIATLSADNPLITTQHPVLLRCGQLRWQEWTERALLGEDGTIREIQSVGRDITVQKIAGLVLAGHRDLAVALLAAQSPEEALERTLEIASRLPGLDCGAVHLAGGETGALELVAQRALRGVATGGEALCEEGVAELVPLPLRCGPETIGRLCVGTHSGQPIPPQTREALETMAAHTETVLARLNAERSVSEHRENLRSLFASIHEMIFVLAPDGRIVEASPSAVATLGYEAGELTDMNIADLHLAEYRPEAAELLEGLRPGSVHALALPLRTRDGVAVPVETVLTTGTWDKRRAVFGVSRDVSDRVRAEHALAESLTHRELVEELRQLSEGLVKAQEAERRRVAAELHDEVGQSLTGLSLLLDNRDGLAPELFARRVAMARQVATRLMHTVRQMSLDLRPAMLDDYGLLRALSALFERYEQQTDVLVRFTHSGLEARLPAALEVASYRIIQEALTNVARHARVREASVAVQATAHDLTLQISDRGSGFLPHVAGRVSTGLAGMKERARALGGIVHVESSPDAGTVVTAVIPITQKAGED